MDEVTYKKFIKNWNLYLTTKTTDFLKDMHKHVLKLVMENSSFDVPDLNPDKPIKVIQCNNTEKINLFIINCILFYIKSKFRRKYLIGLDFEFNNNGNINKKIALHQIILYGNNNIVIYIIGPQTLDDLQKLIYIKIIYVSHIPKIVQGAEALDVPYLCGEFLTQEQGKKFLRNLIDPRYMCEYYKMVEKSDNKKCSLYEILYSFGVISHTMYMGLTATNKNMNPVGDVNWDVYNMTQNHLYYATYDVVFLKKLFDTLIENFNKNFSNKKMSIKYSCSLSKLAFLFKYGHASFINDIKKIGDAMNNYFFYHNGTKYLLNNIFTDYIKNNLDMSEIGVDIGDIFGVNYIKNIIMIIFKYLYYTKIKHNFTIFKTKTLRFDEKMDKNIIFSELKKMHMKKNITFFNTYQKGIESKKIF